MSAAPILEALDAVVLMLGSVGIALLVSWRLWHADAGSRSAPPATLAARSNGGEG